MLTAVQAVLFTVLLLAAAVADIQKRIIPDSICVLTALAGLFAALAAMLLFFAAGNIGRRLKGKMPETGKKTALPMVPFLFLGFTAAYFGIHL